MCRFFIYFGYKKSLNEIIYNNNENSFIKQSYNKSYLPDLDHNNILHSDYNFDGFGFSWLENDKFLLYKNPIPIFHDPNLLNISFLIKSNIIIGHLRACLNCYGFNNSYFNCHPFLINNIVMIHNGMIKNFKSYFKLFVNEIDNDLLIHIKGDTDSEYILGLFLTFYNKNNDLYSSLQNLISFFKNLNVIAYLNLAFIRDNQIVYTRCSINTIKEPPSLYYNDNFITSEPLNNEDFKIVPINQILKINLF